MASIVFDLCSAVLGFVASWVSIAGVSRGYSPDAVRRFFTAALLSLQRMGSRCMGFRHYGLWAQLPLGVRNLPGPEMEPWMLHWQAGSVTGPPGKSLASILE